MWVRVAPTQREARGQQAVAEANPVPRALVSAQRQLGAREVWWDPSQALPQPRAPVGA